MPKVFAGSGPICAAFVAEVGAYLRLRTLEFHERQAELCGAAAVAVGAPTCALAKGSSAESATGSENRAASRRAMRTYWSTVANNRIPEDIFRDAPSGSAMAELPRLFPTWWALFVRKLGYFFNRCDPTYSRLLEELPRLRAEAVRPRQVLVLSALVQQWREANAERFGLLTDLHYPVIEQRAWAKHAAVTQWFEAQAPGFKTSAEIRAAATAQLYAAFARTTREPPQKFQNN